MVQKVLDLHPDGPGGPEFGFLNRWSRKVLIQSQVVHKGPGSGSKWSMETSWTRIKIVQKGSVSGSRWSIKVLDPDPGGTEGP